MKFKRVVPYNLKKMLPILGIAGIGAVSSCEKVEPIEMPKTSLEFSFLVCGSTVDEMWDWNQKYSFSSLNTFLNQDYVDTIYIVPKGEYPYNKDDVSYLRNQYLEPLVNSSPKIHGKGNFSFEKGEPAKVPEDSLWFVQNGWTINQKQR